MPHERVPLLGVLFNLFWRGGHKRRLTLSVMCWVLQLNKRRGAHWPPSHTCIYASISYYIYIYIYIYDIYIYIYIHPRMANDSGIFTTTTRILFYNSWKQNSGKLQMCCSEFHHRLIHFNTTHSGLYCPYSKVCGQQVCVCVCVWCVLPLQLSV
jgi:hypothetical protein